jgi:TolA-binding protein
MSLEGLRAWIGEVERKLGKRTRVFLALAVIAIGLGGAAIYLAIDARESSVSESDVQALQKQLEAQIAASSSGVAGTGAGEASGTQVAQLEAELRALQSEVTTLKGELELKGEAGGSGKGASTENGKSGSGGSAATSPSGGASGGKLQELTGKAKQTEK